ncbi:MAG TPA: methyl-accepting chemotaxis protein [Rickettsiales bacterium]|nr:methyl-accepting chemotaxis protein [Rickettsiales bacterium]
MKLKNFSLLAKIAAPAALGMLSLIGVAFFANTLLSNSAGTAKVIADVNVKSTVTLASISDHFSSLNTSIYQTLVRKAANKTYDANKDIESIKKDLGTLTQELDDYYGQHPSPDLASVIKEIKGSKEDKIPGYADALTVIQAMLEIDFSGAVNAIEPFTAKYKKVQELLHQIREDSYNDAQHKSDVMFADIAKSQSWGKGIIGVLLLVGFMLNYIMGKELLQSIRKIAEVTDGLAKGDVSVDLEEFSRRDELGVVVEALKSFKANIIRIKDMQKNEEKMRAEAEVAKRAAMGKMADKFEHEVQGIITTVATTASTLYKTAEGMKEKMAKAAMQSGAVSDASEQTNMNVKSVSVAVEEMSASVKEIAAQITKSSTLVSETVQHTEQAGRTVEQLTTAVAQIGNIVELISGISEQINLLALNATIESARAGEAGKGFAVVASEVKNLAGQTGKATEEIAKQIENVKKVSNEVVDVLKDIQTAINNVNQYSGGIASAVEQQSAATGEISGNMRQASERVQHISANIGDVTHGVGNADKEAGEMLHSSEMLSKQSDLLRDRVKDFLKELKN